MLMTLRKFCIPSEKLGMINFIIPVKSVILILRRRPMIKFHCYYGSSCYRSLFQAWTLVKCRKKMCANVWRTCGCLLYEFRRSPNNFFLKVLPSYTFWKSTKFSKKIYEWPLFAIKVKQYSLLILVNVIKFIFFLSTIVISMSSLFLCKNFQFGDHSAFNVLAPELKFGSWKFLI